MPELQKLLTEAIMSKCLSGLLPKARDALRKGIDQGFAAPDSLLDELFTLTWLGRLRWWASICEFVEKPM